jgi:hypothetical protein
MNIQKNDLQYAIKMNRALHTSVQPIERLKQFHFSIYTKYFSDKEDGFIWNRMNANGTWNWKWFSNIEDAVNYMNGIKTTK